MGVYDPITFADIGELFISTTKNGTVFKDYQDGGGFDYNTWLTIPKNSGNNPKPIFNRGLEVTSSLNVNGNLRVDSPFSASIGNGLNVSGSTILSGSLSIQSGSAFYANGNKQFNVGAFSSLVTQSGSAGVSQSVNFEVTDISEGVSVVSNSRITLANSGTYSITFSAQLKEIGGTDSIYLWLKKNGTNVDNTGTKTVVRNNDENIMTVEYIVQSSASDYYEIVFQNVNGHAQLYYEAASGNIPATPSIIITVKQVR
jgi:hypothetical protein